MPTPNFTRTSSGWTAAHLAPQTTVAPAPVSAVAPTNDALSSFLSLLGISAPSAAPVQAAPAPMSVMPADPRLASRGTYLGTVPAATPSAIPAFVTNQANQLSQNNLLQQILNAVNQNHAATSAASAIPPEAAIIQANANARTQAMDNAMRQNLFGEYMYYDQRRKALEGQQGVGPWGGPAAGGGVSHQLSDYNRRLDELSRQISGWTPPVVPFR